jgi:predicted nuclease of predicted toxin-antitoxin system
VDIRRRTCFSILTKDTDFEKYSILRGAPPKVVWLRIGNASNKEVM